MLLQFYSFAFEGYIFRYNVTGHRNLRLDLQAIVRVVCLSFSGNPKESLA
jgi:hypothetical protein